MQRDIPKDPAARNKLVQQVSLRMQASLDWYQGHRAEWTDAYERWYRYPSRPTDLTETDDYEIRLGYCFGLVEQINSKITEPMLQMGVPFGIEGTELGDYAKAENFADIVRSYYAKPNVQDGKRKSKKEMNICGPRWEVDEWLHVEVPGKEWGEIEVEVEAPVIDPKTNEPILRDGKPVMAKMMQKVPGEVARKIITHYGFNTRYPSVFDVYPEPNRTTIDTGQKTDVSWICEDLGELALEDMVREVIWDPITKTAQPRYDFDQLIHDAGDRAKLRYDAILQGKTVDDNYGPLITPVHDWTDAYGRKETTNRKSNDGVSLQSYEDRDKVWVSMMRSATEIRIIAQGKYIIERITDPWHRPRLGYRIENYTTDPRSLFGPGCIRPIRDELDELDITHSLGMQNFFRLVNKMIAVKEKAIISMDDFDPRAGGVVRINEEVDSIGQAIQGIDQANVMNDVLAAESNTKGSVEFVSSNLDASPGIHGTRQSHKTARGMEIIAANIGTRFATMQSQALINEARLGESMEYFISQFQFEKISYNRLTDDGSTVYNKFNKDDIDTQGRGFRFTITVDPLWGNTQAQRQDAQNLFELGIEYEKVRIEARDPSMKKAVLSELFEDLLKKHGRRDVSRIFVLPTGEVDPGTELQILMQGGTDVECKGDLQHHIEVHLLQANSPQLAQAMEAGKADPQTKTRLLLLVQEDLAKMKTFLSDPQGAAKNRLNVAGMTHPGAPT